MARRLREQCRAVGLVLTVAAAAACSRAEVVAPEPAQRRAHEGPTRPVPRSGTELVSAQSVVQEPATFFGTAIDGSEWAIARDGGTTTVELFHLDAGLWGKEGVLTLPEGGLALRGLSLNDGRLLVGTNNSTFSTSEVRAYRRTVSGWVSDPLPALAGSCVYAIDQSGDRAAIGVEGGQVGVLAFDGSSWALEQVITGGTGFGQWLGLSGDTLAVCDPAPPAKVHVFERQAGLWSESTTLSDDLCPNLCQDVALEGDTLVVFSCQVRTFTRSAGLWTVDAPQSLNVQSLGLSLRDGRLVLGSEAGVQVFHRGMGEWVLDQVLEGKLPLGQTAGWVVAHRFDSTFTAYAEVGTACSDAATCPLGHCIDGFCCNSACDLSCAACDVAGSLGLCTPVEGAPRVGHPACAPSSCVDDHTLRRESACGGTLTTCDDGPLVECAPYACSVDACLATCADDADCSSGNVCVDSACVPDVRSCADDHTVVLGNAQLVTCDPYRCADGRCLEACDSTADCSGERVCDSDGRCVDVSEGEASGCDCSVGAPRRSAPLWPLVLLVLALRGPGSRRWSLRSLDDLRSSSTAFGRSRSLRSAPRVGGQRARRGRRDAR